MNDSRVFVDTNIFLYAALEDDFQQGKRTVAVNLLKGLTLLGPLNHFACPPAS